MRHRNISASRSLVGALLMNNWFKSMSSSGLVAVLLLGMALALLSAGGPALLGSEASRDLEADISVEG
jgi:hypothetical protein